MIRATLGFVAITTLFSCTDETLSGYGASDTTWVLKELDGAPFAARVTLEFPEEGALRGKAPCNTYQGGQTAPYPWFKAENIAATRMACPELEAESTYFQALNEMTLAEVGAETLFLSNDAGRKMVFSAE